MKTSSFLRWLRAAVVCAAVGFSFSAAADAGWRFVRWDGDVGGLTAAEKCSPTLAVTTDKALALTAVFCVDIPASAYVQDGLIAQFDGIDNVGTGTHVDGATVWKDLTGHGYDATPNANVVWAGDHWENASDGQPMTTVSTLGGNFLDGNLTVEFCAKPSRHSSRATFVGQYNGSTGYGIEHVASSGKIRVWINGSPDYTSPATLLANELGTIAVVSSPTDVSVYKNGALGGSASGKYTGKPQDRAFVMGGEPSRANMGMRGSYYACRFYNRHLTPDEIAYNANIDKIRFEQADPATLTWPDGYKYEDGKIKAKMTLAFGNVGGGGFLIDGEPQTAGDVWLEVGKEVQVTVVPDDLYAFGLWEDSADLLTAAEKASATIAVRGVGGHRVLTAKFRCIDPSLVAYAGDPAGVKTSYYVQDGLVWHFDGIDNQATGAHVPDAMTWKDLKGAADDWVLTEGCGSFATTGNALDCIATRKSGYAAKNTASATLGKVYSIETALRSDGAQATRYVFRLGDYTTYGRCLTFGSGRQVYGVPYSVTKIGYYDTGKAEMTVSVAYNKEGNAHTVTRMLVNCTDVTDYGSSAHPSWYQDAATPVLGAAWGGGSMFLGPIFSMRGYSRPLEVGEATYNTHLDQARFGLCGNVHVIGVPREFGSPSPAYGSATNAPLEVISFSAGPLTEYADGVTAADGGEGVRAKCLGYSFPGSDEIHEGTSFRSEFVDGMVVIWRWQVQYRVTVDGKNPQWVDDGADVTVTVPAGTSALIGTDTPVTVDGTKATFKVTRACDVKPLMGGPGVVRYWTGAADASAKNPENWQTAGGVAGCPAEGDTVILNAGAQPMTWDLDGVTLANWVQAGYTGTVTFQTGRDGLAKGAAKVAHGVLLDDGETKALKVTGSVSLASGTWTHTAQPAFNKNEAAMADFKGIWRIVADVGGDFMLGEGATIDVTSKGFGTLSVTGAADGAHGGFSSGYWGPDGDGPAYGSIKCVQSLGSRTGGGNVELHVGGLTTLNGTIVASSAAASSGHGSGGGIWIDTGSLVGSGTVSARPGACPNGGGAGGRIALWVNEVGADFSKFTGQVTAQDAGTRSNTGTIYYQTAADNGNGELLVLGSGDAGNGYSDTETRFGYGTGVASGDLADSTFRRLTIKNCGRAAVLSGQTLRVDEIVADAYRESSVIMLKGGVLEMSGDWTPEKMSVRAVYAGSTIRLGADGDGTLTVTSSSSFFFNQALTVEGDVEVVSGGSIIHSTASSVVSRNGVRLHVTGDMNVAAGGAVNVNGRGYAAKAGPGHPVVENYTARGGAYGGAAYDLGGVTTYGSLREPALWGSGGNAGAGGGEIGLTVDGTLTVNGTVSANGAGSKESGAGGSVWIVTPTLTGSGTISANGGDGEKAVFNAGGGGRIAVTLTDPEAKVADFGGKIEARGGLCNGGLGAANGTIYLRDGGQGETEGTLVIDGAGKAITQLVPTEISTEVTETDVGNVVIGPAGAFTVLRSAVLAVHGDFSSTSEAEFALGVVSDGVEPGGCISFVDLSRTSVVSGTNRFAALSVTEPGKQVNFAAGEGSLAEIVPSGVFTVTGEETNRVKLRSSVEGTQWLFKLDEGSSVVVTYADVQDSDARPGLLVSVDDTNVSSGNNDNWSLVSIRPGDTITWTGQSSAAWGDPSNWDPLRVPVETDHIVIVAGTDYTPELSAPLSAWQLDIRANAVLKLNGFNLTVTDDFFCNGTLDASVGQSQIVFEKAVTLKHFVRGGSTVVLNGVAVQTVDFGAQALNALVVENDVSFTDGFSSAFFTAVATTARELVFGAGKEYGFANLTLNGIAVVDEERVSVLTLRSSEPGSPWTLSVSSKAEVKGVLLSDSHAKASLAAELPSQDRGGNANWIFDVSSATWTGGSKETAKLWATPENWADGLVPDATSRVVFEGAATVTLPAEGATIRALEIKSSGGTVLLKGSADNAPLVVNDLLEIYDGGVLSQQLLPIVVTHDAFVRAGGKLTHPDNANAADLGYGIDLTVGGDLYVEKNGTISATSKGFSIGSSGPGGCSGAGHGGWCPSTAGGKQSYGSIFRPVTLGSCGSTTGSDNGGGRVRVVVAGTVNLEGTIEANGMESGNYCGSGGSVWLTCGMLKGAAGEVQANGGWFTAYYDPGCGGRVAVYQTTATDFAAFTGKIIANGGGKVGSGNFPSRAPGTVYRQSAGEREGGGTITLWNGGGSTITVSGSTYTGGRTDFPVLVDPDVAPKAYQGVTVAVRYGSALNITSDVTIRELELESGGRVVLNGHTLTIRSWAHKQGKGWPEKWKTEIVMPGADAAGNPGQVVWAPRPLTLIVR